LAVLDKFGSFGAILGHFLVQFSADSALNHKKPPHPFVQWMWCLGIQAALAGV